jgi:AcrR family transcriptional regulator
MRWRLKSDKGGDNVKKKLDRRVAKTRASLALALFALMQKRGWNSISIQELCDEANVARASFYTHFDSKLALLDFLIAEVFDKQIAASSPPADSKAYVAFLIWLVDHVTSSRALFSNIAKEPEALPVLDRFKRALQKRFLEALYNDGIVVDEWAVTFVMGGTFDLLLNWSKRWRLSELPQLRLRILEMARAIIDGP